MCVQIMKGGDTMKKWSNPEMWTLSAGNTEVGANGGRSDLFYVQEKNGHIHIGTSGALEEGDTKGDPYKF